MLHWERLVGASLKDEEHFSSKERGTGQENNPSLGKPCLLTDGVGHPCGHPIFWMEGIFPRHPENLIHELQLSVTPDSHPTRPGACRVNWAPSTGEPATSEPTWAVFSEPISSSALPCSWERQSTTSDEWCGTKPGAPLQSWSKQGSGPNQTFAAAWSYLEGHQ